MASRSWEWVSTAGHLRSHLLSVHRPVAYGSAIRDTSGLFLIPDPFVQTSGGNEGPCSGNAGTLMYAEIASILTQTSGISPSLDSDAAVKSIVWDKYVEHLDPGCWRRLTILYSNQWVSYDDAESFAIKMN